MIAEAGRYKILKAHHSKRPYIVIDSLGPYHNHSHFSTQKGAESCIEFLRKKQKPTKSKYMIEAVKRVAGEAYESFSIKRKKDRYRNRR